MQRRTGRERTGSNSSVPTTCLNAVVERGKVITAAGVSSGIDMGLVLVDRLFGPERAQLIQLAIEYDPQPPFDAGSPTKAPKDIVDVARPLLADTLSDAV
jgi:hypothetical protein